MRNKREYDDTFKFKSIFTGEYVMAHQWVAEVLVDRKASREKKSLPYKYWKEDPVWAKEFTKQVQQAGILMKRHGQEAVLNVIKKEAWTYSLLNKTIIQKIKEEAEVIKNRKVSEEKPVEDPNTFTPVKKKKKSLLGKLNERNKEET